MAKSLYEKIGFKEPPFIEAGAATNVTPYIPDKILKQLDVTTECALSGQCSPLILGGAAGSGKTTLTKYYFSFKINEEFGEKITNSLIVHYTISDTDELRDVTVFYNRLIHQALDEVKKKSPKNHRILLKECELEERIKSKDTKNMLTLFKDINLFLRKHFSPLIYVIDEIDYVVDLITEKNYIFIQHLRDIISFFSEIRFVVFVLASTKLPASFIRAKLLQALGPMEDRISESIELKYSEEDFLKFVKTRFKEPIIEEKDGEFVKRSIRVKTRDILEKEYGDYFPFTENSLRYLYKKVKGEGVTIERLRILERHLAKLINIYCSKEYASTKDMISGRILNEKAIEKFLTVEEAITIRTPSIHLTPKEQEWFADFFGFTSGEYQRFSHERCVSAISLSLSKYLETRQLGGFPTDIDQIKRCIQETKKGLKFFAYARKAPFFNLGVAIALFRDQEIERYGWNSLKEIIDTLYSLTPLIQKKIIIVCVDDDFEFAKVAIGIEEHMRVKEREMCIKEEDVENIEVVNDRLMIKSANSFRIIFIKYSNLVNVVSTCAKTNRTEIIEIGDQYFQSLHSALVDWSLITYDFHKYQPSMERILQSAILFVGTYNKLTTTEKRLQRFFGEVKIKRDRFSFNDLRLNGFLREVKTGVFQISIPPVLTYLFKNYEQFSPTQITRVFGGVIGAEIIRFLTSFLGFEKTPQTLTFEDVDLENECSSTKELIERYEEISGSQAFKTHFEAIEKIEKMNFKTLDEELDLEISAGFVLTERVAAHTAEAIKSQLESTIRKIQEGKAKQQKIEIVLPDAELVKRFLERSKFEEDGFLQFVRKPKTWNQIRKKYSEQGFTDEQLWLLLKKLHEENKILLRIKERGD